MIAMHKYYLLKFDRTNPRFEAHFNCILLDGNDLPIPSPFYSGDSLTPNTFKLKVLSKGTEIGRIYDRVSISIQNNEPFLVVSEKVRNLLHQFSSEIEFHQVRLSTKEFNKSKLFAVNVLNFFDAIDYDKSELIYWDEEHTLIYNIDKLQLNLESLKSRPNIFLLANFRGTVVVVSELFKEVIEDNGVVGFKFVSSNEFMI